MCGFQLIDHVGMVIGIGWSGTGENDFRGIVLLLCASGTMDA